MVEFTREEHNIIAKNRGIIEPENMSTQELINALNRYDSRRKVKNIRKELLGIGLEGTAKIQNISKNGLSKAEKLQVKIIDELKEIARLRRIKNTEKLTKEDLIITLLKCESSATEQNFKKLFNNNNNNNDDNNNNNNMTTLIISNNKIEDIIKLVTSLKDSGLSLEGFTETVQNEVQEKKGGFLSMLLGTLCAILLGNLLTGRGVNRADEGIVRAGYGNKMDF